MKWPQQLGWLVDKKGLWLLMFLAVGWERRPTFGRVLAVAVVVHAYRDAFAVPRRLLGLCVSIRHQGPSLVRYAVVMVVVAAAVVDGTAKTKQRKRNERCRGRTM